VHGRLGHGDVPRHVGLIENLTEAQSSRTQNSTEVWERCDRRQRLQFETTVPGLYCIGSAGLGTRTSGVFIENGILHAERAIGHLVEPVRARAAAGA
jgi:hypothetical protein